MSGPSPFPRTDAAPGQTLRALLLPALVLAAPLPARAQEVIELDPIRVTEATLPAAWAQSGIAGDTLEREYQGAGLAGVLRGMPGVTTQGGTADGAETAVNIRGLQDYGRVAVTIDGVRQNFARSGHGANGTFAIDPEMLRAIAVTRGPGARAGAIAGAVEMRTVRAEDLLPADGGASGGEVRLRFGNLTDTPTAHGAIAARLGAAADLTLATTRSGSGDYTAPDGTRVHAWQRNRSALARLGLHSETGRRFGLSVSRLAKDYVTGRAAGTARDTALRTTTLALDHAGDIAGWAVTGTLYATTTDVAQREVLTGAGRAYRTATTGLLVEAARSLDLGHRSHDLAVTLESFRDRVTTDDPGGQSLTPSGARSFWSLAVEDRIGLGPGTLTLGLSADSYRLQSPDGRASGERLSPRVAFDLPLGRGVTLHAAAALAYRFPSLNETLVSGLHPEPADFVIRPNPDLAPERMRALELGISYARDGVLTGEDSLTLRASLFHNEIRDYIGLERVGGLFDAFYRYNNIDRVRISGLELEAGYNSARAFGSLAGQIMEGIDLGTGAGLSRVPPNRLVLTAGLRSRDGRGAYGLRLTSVGAKAGDLPAQAWQTVDLFLQRRLSDTATLGLALNNVTNQTYTPHLETQPAPGFNAQASLIVRF